MEAPNQPAPIEDHLSEEADISDDPFLRLLTDALRAGPKSPEWQQAIDQLRASTLTNRDQYLALVQARENLESGKSYRQVRAGAGFGRKVMASLENEPGRTSNGPGLSAGLLSYVGVALVLGAVALLVFHISGAGNEDLSSSLYTPVAATSFDTALPAGLRQIGELPVDPRNSLASAPPRSGGEYLGGGVVTASGIPESELFAVQATLHFGHVSDAIIPQLFVTDSGNFNPAMAVSGHELLWLVRNGQGQVILPDGSVAGEQVKINDNATVTVEIRVGARQAMVSVDGKSVWSGSSQLAEKPRFPGVRLLRKGGDRKDQVLVTNLKVLER